MSKKTTIFEERSRELERAVQELADLAARLRAHLAQAALPADVKCTCNEPGAPAAAVGDHALWCAVHGNAQKALADHGQQAS
jgi:hypothetical protein